MSINSENAKIIREPMQIQVMLDTLDSQPLTVTGSGTWKIADFTTVTDDYPMRLLADLQGDGFPLNGSCVLYDSSVAASQSAGKIGIRSVLQGYIYMTVSASRIISALTIHATGASTARLDNVEYEFDDNNTVYLAINSTSASIRLSPADSTHRIEVSGMTAGVVMEITNDDIISCQLNLRSDLQPIDPSLPESEIEIRIHETQDVTDVMARVMEGQPITYSAGYAGDMSPERRFYMSEPATWEDNVLTIKGTDAVNKLDSDVIPALVGRYQISNSSGAWVDTKNVHRRLYLIMKDQLQTAGVKLVTAETQPVVNYHATTRGSEVVSVIEPQSRRDLIANMMNLLHQDYTPIQGMGSLTSFWLTYVDAGRPSLTWTKPTSKWDIYEADCGDIKRDVGRTISKIIAKNKEITTTFLNYRSLTQDPTQRKDPEKPKNNINLGPYKIHKDKGAEIDLDEYTSGFMVFWKATSTDTGIYVRNAIIDGTLSSNYDARQLPKGSTAQNDTYGYKVYDGNYWQAWDAKPETGSNPQTLPTLWDSLLTYGDIETDDTELEMQLYGTAHTIREVTDEYSVFRNADGITAEPSKTSWTGAIRACRNGETSIFEGILPYLGFMSLFDRSQETGSFTWKGDPRIQPRDVFTFHKLDGTTELRTVESIELKHEGGGTVSEITYRKGIV